MLSKALRMMLITTCHHACACASCESPFSPLKELAAGSLHPSTLGAGVTVAAVSGKTHDSTVTVAVES